MFSHSNIDTSSWLASQSTSAFIAAINQLVSREKKESIPIAPEGTDYGYSFGGLNEVKQTLLTEVRQIYTHTDHRPHGADIGAGLGSMTWKLLAAGATVDAFEISQPAAEECLKRLKQLEQTHPALWEGESCERLVTLHIGNALTMLQEARFANKYDFIWLGNIIHFLTPTDLEILKTVFQHTLKPGGKIFAEVNTLTAFSNLTNYKVVREAHQRAQEAQLAFPEFLAFNGATVIDKTANRIVRGTIVSAFNMQEMIERNLPIQAQCYKEGFIGQDSEVLSPAEEMLILAKTIYLMAHPAHRLIINRFHQALHLLTEETATRLFETPDCYNLDSFYLQETGYRNIPFGNHSEKAPLLALIFKKDRPALSYESCRFQFQPAAAEPRHAHLLKKAEALCEYRPHYAKYLETIKKGEYAFALRQACAVGSLPLVHLLLKHQHDLKMDLNQPSLSNGRTALDWIRHAAVSDNIKTEISQALINRGAKTGSQLSVASKSFS